METVPTPDDLEFLKGWHIAVSETHREGFIRLRLHRFSPGGGEPASVTSPGIAVELQKLRAFHAELGELLAYLEGVHGSTRGTTGRH